MQRKQNVNNVNVTVASRGMFVWRPTSLGAISVAPTGIRHEYVIRTSTSLIYRRLISVLKILQQQNSQEQLRRTDEGLFNSGFEMIAHYVNRRVT